MQKKPARISESTVGKTGGDEPSPGERADTFQLTREARRKEISEDYVELISDLIAERGEARPVDIAERLGVTQPTVTKTLARLQREGLVEREPYRSVFLSEEGDRLATRSRQRHRIVVAFLEALGIDRTTAEQDAEGIEHHVSDRSLRAFERFLEDHRPDGTDG